VPARSGCSRLTLCPRDPVVWPVVCRTPLAVTGEGSRARVATLGRMIRTANASGVTTSRRLAREQEHAACTGQTLSPGRLPLSHLVRAANAVAKAKLAMAANNTTSTRSDAVSRRLIPESLIPGTPSPPTRAR
jgi:hypothetical protein